MKKLISIFFIIFVFGCSKSSSDVNSKFGGTGTGGSLARFTIVGSYLYTVDRENLQVFSLSRPELPVFIRSVHVGFEIETIYPFKDKLFIGSTSVVHIFSISDPSSPQKQGEAISPDFLRRCDPVVAKDTVAYATLRVNGPCGGTQSVLAVYDIKNISHPIHKKAVPVTEPYGLGYADHALYVCDKFQGLVVFDITQAYNPVMVKQIGLSGNVFIDVIPVNDILVCWTSKGMALYDISNRLNPVLITQIV